MDNYNLLYLVYGMCLMFHLMMGWVFCFRKNGLAKKLIGALMFLVALQYFKDLFMLQGFYGEGAYAERVASSIDVVTVPLYVLILVEFCRPHWLNMRRIVVSELPFILLSLLYVLTRYALFYHLMMSLALYIWCVVRPMDHPRASRLPSSAEGRIFLRRGYQPALVAWCRTVVLCDTLAVDIQ